ncbi:hypothetical protein AGDE_16014 [Angomonas deanei]|uniref:CHCH domain containing protein n=1 Tax=Angomonas deanei TaxID=59799 RepID=A0A7G2CMD3_9TRYP|nr:hypothetical protein AGDE_16014 [Angomonas deanei]CAD2220227.1 hypothetical protein, conserved [Angomonas deanei]|eukprot:EPY17922.1 hypothetical protein AGDE_16014 [Angomonas deanei]
MPLFLSQRSAQANSSFTSNTALAAWKGSSRTEVPDLSVGAPSAADHSKTTGAPSPPHHTPHKKGTAPQAVSVPVTPAVEQGNATAKPVSANACATHVSGYRKCLEVNPDAKMNCTWALDNYMKCQETLIE